jgi:hypothetical protein
MSAAREIAGNSKNLISANTEKKTNELQSIKNQTNFLNEYGKENERVAVDQKSNKFFEWSVKQRVKKPTLTRKCWIFWCHSGRRAMIYILASKVIKHVDFRKILKRLHSIQGIVHGASIDNLTYAWQLGIVQCFVNHGAVLLRHELFLEFGEAADLDCVQAI